jgi:hypothetical protein
MFHPKKRIVEDEDGSLVDPGVGSVRSRHGGKRIVEDEDGEFVDPAVSNKRARYGGKRLVEDEDDDDDGDGLVDDDDDDDDDGGGGDDGDDDGGPEDYDSADDYDDELYKNPQDRAELLAKSDLEREMILSDRHDQKQRRNETLQVRAMMRAERAKAAKAKPAASKERNKGQQSAQKAKAKAQAEMQAKRQEKARREQLRQLAREESRRRDDEAEAAAAHDEGAREATERLARAPARAARPEAEAEPEAPAESAAPIESLERIRLTRTKIERWLNEPFFETVLPGCFVRVGIGQHDQCPIYRVAEVTGVKEGFRLYTIEKKQTTKRLELRIGASKRYFEISYISNTDFDISELNKYQRILQVCVGVHCARRLRHRRRPLRKAPPRTPRAQPRERYPEHRARAPLVPLRRAAGCQDALANPLDH